MPSMKTTQQMRDELLLRGRFKQWFGNSVVADKKGRPKPVYHSTDQQFSVFKTDGLGFHVGTKGQARDIGGSRMIKAYASLQNPLRMADMGERWDSAPRMTDALLDQGTLTDEEGSAIMGQPRERQLQALKDLLISKGHDGIVYENEHEGRGGDSYLLFHPHQIKATTNKAPTMSPDIHMAAGGSVQRMRDELLLKGSGGTVKAPVTPTGFYSPLEEAALNIQRKSGNAQAFMNDLRTVPKEHLQHAGVDRLLTSRPTITREELQQHVARAAPKVEVKVMGGQGAADPAYSDYTADDAWARENDDGTFTAFLDEELISAEHATEEAAIAAAEEALSKSLESLPTKFSKYTLPGGQNYREVLLTLPRNKPEMYGVSIPGRNFSLTHKYGVQYLGKKYEFDTHAEAEKFYNSVNPGKDFESSHWDEPNVLAHFRINDRTDKDGKKVLFVEEIQSDWGQEGKKKGFADPAAGSRAEEIGAEMNRLAADREMPSNRIREEARWHELARQRDDLMRRASGLPSAPFVTKTNDWVNLALKHIMKMAAEEGHDRVAFVKGEQAADRFGLDKHFSRVAARPTPTGGYQLQTILKDGSREDSVDVPPNKLHEYVGEDLAKKIHGQGGGVFEGGDLKMPQTGMRKFYDELVPQQAHALVKKFGGQGVKPIQVQTGEQGAQVVPNGTGWGVVWNDGVFTPAKSREHADQLATPYSEHPGFDITPEMRQAILKPMSYKVGGAVAAMDAMRLQVWDKRRGR